MDQCPYFRSHSAFMTNNDKSSLPLPVVPDMRASIIHEKVFRGSICQAMSSARLQKEGYYKILVCIKSVCNISDVPVQALLNMVEQSSKEGTGGLDADICNPPYNIRQAAESANLEYDQPAFQNMSVIVDMVSISRDWGAWAHGLSCALAQKPCMICL